MKRRWGWALALAGGWLIGCSSTDMDGGPANGDGGRDARTTTPTPEGGGSDAPEATHQTVGSSGGTVHVEGVVLTIPAGALAADTPISITPSSDAVPSDYDALSQLYSFGPDGTVFLHPITVSFTLTSADPDPVVFWSNPAGGYDALPTTASAASASASISHFSKGFAGRGHHREDAAVETGPGMVDAQVDAEPMEATATADAGVEDAGAEDAVADAGVVDPVADADAVAVDAAADTGPDDAAASSDAVAAADSGQEASLQDASSPDSGGVADTGTVDTGQDAAATDATTEAASADAGPSGITVNVDNVLTTFAANAMVKYLNGVSIIDADDNASSTHWHLQLQVTTVPQQACSPTGTPVISYTHFTSGVADAFYSTQQMQGYCNILVISTATGPGQHARGQFSAGVDRAPDVGGTPLHLLTNGSYDVVYIPPAL
jgi:hypothetical protein